MKNFFGMKIFLNSLIEKEIVNLPCFLQFLNGLSFNKFRQQLSISSHWPRGEFSRVFFWMQQLSKTARFSLKTKKNEEICLFVQQLLGFSNFYWRSTKTMTVISDLQKLPNLTTKLVYLHDKNENIKSTNHSHFQCLPTRDNWTHPVKYFLSTESSSIFFLQFFSSVHCSTIDQKATQVGS